MEVPEEVPQPQWSTLFEDVNLSFLVWQHLEVRSCTRICLTSWGMMRSLAGHVRSITIIAPPTYDGVKVRRLFQPASIIASACRPSPRGSITLTLQGYQEGKDQQQRAPLSNLLGPLRGTEEAHIMQGVQELVLIGWKIGPQVLHELLVSCQGVVLKLHDCHTSQGAFRGAEGLTQLVLSDCRQEGQGHPASEACFLSQLTSITYMGFESFPFAAGTWPLLKELILPNIVASGSLSNSLGALQHCWPGLRRVHLRTIETVLPDLGGWRDLTLGWMHVRDLAQIPRRGQSALESFTLVGIWMTDVGPEDSSLPPVTRAEVEAAVDVLVEYESLQAHGCLALELLNWVSPTPGLTVMQPLQRLAPWVHSLYVRGGNLGAIGQLLGHCTRLLVVNGTLNEEVLEHLASFSALEELSVGYSLQYTRTDGVRQALLAIGEHLPHLRRVKLKLYESYLVNLTKREEIQLEVRRQLGGAIDVGVNDDDSWERDLYSWCVLRAAATRGLDMVPDTWRHFWRHGALGGRQAPFCL